MFCRRGGHAHRYGSGLALAPYETQRCIGLQNTQPKHRRLIRSPRPYLCAFLPYDTIPDIYLGLIVSLSVTAGVDIDLANDPRIAHFTCV